MTEFSTIIAFWGKVKLLEVWNNSKPTIFNLTYNQHYIHLALLGSSQTGLFCQLIKWFWTSWLVIYKGKTTELLSDNPLQYCPLVFTLAAWKHAWAKWGQVGHWWNRSYAHLCLMFYSSANICNDWTYAAIMSMRRARESSEYSVTASASGIAFVLRLKHQSSALDGGRNKVAFLQQLTATITHCSE